LVEHLPFTIRRLERLGVSAIIIEDKTGAKKNSLSAPSEVVHIQDSIENFSLKIQAAKKAQITDTFMCIARIESLITGAGQDDALSRSRAFIDAGTDGIMIHSRESDGKEIFNFCRQYNQWTDKVPLVAVPTNYSSIYEDALSQAGIKVIIYANQLLRSAYTAMNDTAVRILRDGRAYDADQDYISATGLIKLIDGN
jgi:phosphoenolpyruvate phosphomutase